MARSGRVQGTVGHVVPALGLQERTRGRRHQYPQPVLAALVEVSDQSTPLPGPVNQLFGAPRQMRGVQWFTPRLDQPIFFAGDRGAR